MRKLLMAAAAVAATLAIPTAANASRVEISGGVVYYYADPGETNVLKLGYNKDFTPPGRPGPGAVHIIDEGHTASGSAIPIRSSTCDQGFAHVHCFGQIRAVLVKAGDGNDTVYPWTTTDFPQWVQMHVYGEAGDDTITGGDAVDSYGGGDRLYGGDGRDVIAGGGKKDYIWGDAGDDKLHGDDGDDNLYGGDGGDALIGDAGNDWLAGGEGNDLIDARDGALWDYGTCDGGYDLVQKDPGETFAASSSAACEG